MNLSKVKNLLEEALKEFVFSGFQLAFSYKGQSTNLCGGLSSYFEPSVAVSDESLFDIASLTKVVLTTSVIAKRVEEGTFSLESKVSDYLAEFKKNSLGSLPIRSLLNHSSGLPWWVDLKSDYKGEGLRDWFSAHVDLLQKPPFTAEEYSDLGFWLLGCCLESKEKSLETQFETYVKRPLGLNRTQFGPVAREISVATEHSPVRGRLLHGEVFDENSFVLGGKTAHAGLFSNALDLVKFANAWLEASKGRSKWLKKTTCDLFTHRPSDAPSGSYALGWDTRSKVNSSSGKYLSEMSFGHLGYTGTSIWIDPKEEVFVVCLTNRVHPSRVDDRIRQFRIDLHNAIMESFKNEG